MFPPRAHMTFAPVLIREFREEARRPANRWVRVGVAALLATIFCVLISTGPQAGRASGDYVFPKLHALLFGAIWLVVPVMTADCISRERREGTLGLLFLTPLTPTGVVIGKSALQIIRALTLVLAAMPMLAGCFALGGVTWFDFGASLLINLTSLFLALSAGMLASALSREWPRALAAAIVFSGVGLFGLLASFVVPVYRGPSGALFRSSPFGAFSWALNYCSDANSDWSRMAAAATAAQLSSAMTGFAVRLLAAVAIFGFVLVVAGLAVRHAAQESPPSPFQLWLRKIFCEPLWLLRLFRALTRRKLDAAPLSWLQQRSWNARLTKWGWCLGLVVVETVLITFFSLHDFLGAQAVAGAALLFGISLSSAGSYRVERQNGVLELLLVTPMSEGELIRSRIWNVWLQFLPATAVFVFAVLAADSVLPNSFETAALLQYFGIIAATMPFVGLYFALRTKHFITAWVCTFGFSFALPLSISVVTSWSVQGLALPLFLSFMLSVVLLARAQGTLTARRFLLHTP
ncbi:MAG: ABC transporter permease subunit [Verrucomicrobia bacterium]|nr:ABC transporter permease subunit [Verrucomicrobiota bacterium]